MILSEKSLKPFKHLCIFETQNIGICFQYLNQIPIDRSDLVLEISPTPRGGIFILQSDDDVEISYHHEKFHKLSADQILDSVLINNIHPSLILAYLSQSQVPFLDNMIIVEKKSLSEAFLEAQKITDLGAEALDLRCLRSTTHKTIVYLTTSKNLQEETATSLAVVINQVDKHLKSYFRHD